MRGIDFFEEVCYTESIIKLKQKGDKKICKK